MKTTQLFSLFFLFLNIPLSAQTFDWISQISSDGDVFANNLVVDNAGNTYLVGIYNDSVSFDPNSGSPKTGTFSGLRNQDAYIAKYNKNGGLIWMRYFGGPGNEQINGIAMDNSGFIYCVGYYHNTVDFDPDGLGTFSMTSNGSSDAFVSKFDNNGNWIWTRGIGGSSADRARTITLDTNNNVYIGGAFNGTIDFDPGAGTDTFSAGNRGDAFLWSLTSDGNYRWTKTIPSTGIGVCNSITRNSKNEILIGCNSNLNNFITDSVYFANFSSLGTLNWERGISSSYIRIFGIITDQQDNVIITGDFDGTTPVDFDPSSGVSEISATNWQDGYLAKYDENGDFIWVKHLRVTSASNIATTPYGLDLDRSENIYISGLFNGTVDFDPSDSDSLMVTSQGGSDIFISCFKPNGDFLWNQTYGGSENDNATECYISRMDKLLISGNFNSTVDFDPTPGTASLTASGRGFDAYLHQIDICLESFSAISESTCQTYVSPSGKTFNTTGTFFDTLVNAAGCDSIITIDLTIFQIDTSFSATACQIFVAPSGKTVDTSGTVLDTIPATNGCDSIMTINLTVNKVDTSVSELGIRLISNETGAFYQWIDCNNGFAPINDETDAAFSPSRGGSYAVIVLKNGCADTSRCYLSTVGLEDRNSFLSSLSVSPNPTQQDVSIDLGKAYHHILMEVRNSIGQLIMTQSYLKSNTIKFGLQGESGLYNIHLQTDSGQKAVIRILKE